MMKTNTVKNRKSLVKQEGSNLIEVLVSILIFAMGILGILGLQASTVGVAADARYRTEASALADDYIARMMSAPPDTVAAEYATGGSKYNDWYSSRIDGAGVSQSTVLPQGTLRAVIAGGADEGKNVTITVTWQAGSDAAADVHQHITRTVIPPTPPVAP
jgi:type IV pilus assembly protein PilV